MRIVSVNVHYQDKLGYQDYYLGKAWKKMGHEVHFISSDVHFDFPDYDNTIKHIIGEKYVGLGLYLNDYGVPVHRLKGTSKKRTGFIWLKGFKEKVFELKPDILVLHGILSYQTMRATFWASKLNCRIIVDDHTTSFLLGKDMKRRLLYSVFRRLFATRIEKMSEKVIGVSTTIVDVIKDHFGIHGPKVQMIPLGADVDLFHKSAEVRNEGRKLVEALPNELVVLYTGKMYEDKKVHLIIDALNDDTITIDKSIVIVLVGNASASYKLILDKSISKSKWRVEQISTVPQEKLPLFYNAADIAVWPGSLTTSTIDASACGCPIIISNQMPERTKYENGFMIEDGNLEQLKEALLKLLHSPILRREMGDNGVRYVESELSWHIIAKKFIA
ncbi:glycosyltransferase family 4 protein [Segetibacter aerophilus]|uniref:Glycosyl transferase family 1 n=1 Tax=Segetibacter aerophilus TaxID=670293 RepID=A0A512BD97_9BACT|nr:glycosyltransferase family 4 protein [Segetibacter aerophilus]GEO09904.1 hypothetical protein SAE01_24000 [Segetibacter aerophilus]